MMQVDGRMIQMTYRVWWPQFSDDRPWVKISTAWVLQHQISGWSWRMMQSLVICKVGNEVGSSRNYLGIVMRFIWLRKRSSGGTLPSW